MRLYLNVVRITEPTTIASVIHSDPDDDGKSIRPLTVPYGSVDHREFKVIQVEAIPPLLWDSFEPLSRLHKSSILLPVWVRCHAPSHELSGLFKTSKATQRVDSFVNSRTAPD